MTTDEKIDAIMALLNSFDERLPPAVASVRQIRGQYGDCKINFVPKQWTQSGGNGPTASACSADFLECYAETLEYMARNPKEGSDPKYIVYNRKDARLCRRWAIEKRSGKPPAPAAPKASTEALFRDSPKSPAAHDDDIPF